jgi:hypothetical protein
MNVNYFATLNVLHSLASKCTLVIDPLLPLLHWLVVVYQQQHRIT